MKNLNQNATYLLIALGLGLIATSRITGHYLNSDSYDFLLGAIGGVGIGLLIVAIMNGKFRKSKSA